LEFSKQLIRKINPITIVVANVSASKIFEEIFVATFNDKLGHHEIMLNNNRKIPVFFCSMLTGQRAMDSYSFERLKWQIGQTIKGIRNEY
jgi:hypothetical protein